MNLNFIPQELKTLAGSGMASGKKALETQARYSGEFFKTNTTALAELSNTQMSNMREAVAAKTFSDVYETNRLLFGTWWQKMQGVYQQNTKLVEEYQKEMGQIFSLEGELSQASRQAAESVLSSVAKRAKSAAPEEKGSTSQAAK